MTFFRANLLTVLKIDRINRSSKLNFGKEEHELVIDSEKDITTNRCASLLDSSLSAQEVAG